MEKKWKILALVAFVVLSGIVYLTTSFSGDSEVTVALKADENASASIEVETTVDFSSPAVIYVHVAGAVNVPGVYALSEGDRVWKAIDKAGGLTGNADGTAVNQARKLKDGEQLYIPEIGEETAVYANGVQLVDINKATKDQLMTLPGIGEARANDIITYRNSNGGFDSIEAIMEIEGIKEAMFEKLAPLITVGR